MTTSPAWCGAAWGVFEAEWVGTGCGPIAYAMNAHITCMVWRCLGWCYGRVDGGGCLYGCSHSALLYLPGPACSAPCAAQVCDRADDEENMLLCDGCDRGCHTACTSLRRLPDSPTWYCSGCADKSGTGKKAGAATAATPVLAAQQQQQQPQQGSGRLQKQAAAPVVAAAAAVEVLSDSDDDADIFAPPKVVVTAQVGCCWRHTYRYNAWLTLC